MAGLGRGAGNCQMELLLGFLHDPRYEPAPRAMHCVQRDVEPLRSKCFRVGVRLALSADRAA